MIPDETGNHGSRKFVPLDPFPDLAAEPVWTIDLVTQDPKRNATNVPRTVVGHPEIETLRDTWAPARELRLEIALNLLNAVVPPGADGDDPVECAQGLASWTAARLHRKFTNRWFGAMEPRMTLFTVAIIRAWIAEHDLD